MSATQASAQEHHYDFNVPAQPLNAALQTFARQAQLQVIFAEAETKSLRAPPLNGSYSADEALQILLAGTELKVSRTSKGVLQIAANPDPQSGSAAGDGANGTVQALIVTAQKKEEDIQDVPIAISAFTQEQLERSQVAGGPDLMTQVPNMTFTKTNFSSYSIQLRGIGTQAISATVDAAVAVAFNNTPFIRNRFFEQEFYDLQRVEVLRGPQGTLYGRNATAGVVNLISQKPKFVYEAKVSADIANYGSTRVEGMLNIPLANDVAALRVAGAWTKRDGYAFNQITGAPIDGRDLWSTRVSLRFAPNDAFDANLIWEHFQENDDRLRSGKQLCKTDEVTSLTAIHPDGTVQVFQTTHLQTLPEGGQPLLFAGVQGTFSQGCGPASLYSPDSFGTPNGLSLPYYSALSGVGLPIGRDDPYVSRSQSHDLRTIESTVDPDYKAKSDVVELQANIDLTDSLTLSSETAYSNDFVFSVQDYNRFNTASGAWSTTSAMGMNAVARGILSPEGVFCDPQIGCADRLVGVDLSTGKSKQFSQELRLSSDFNGPFNFSLGANFLRFDGEDKYYVFVNSLTLYAALRGNNQNPQYQPNVTDNLECMASGRTPQDPNGAALIGGCQYIDPNPIGSLNDQGHNYFLSKNPYKLISYAAFGEAYYNFTDDLKLTAGLRWTVDKKEAPIIPSWLLAADSVGLSVAQVVDQEWREPTGRLALDWKPHLSFTDETLLYASYARGYKAGGANPPAAGLVCYADCDQYAEGWAARTAAHPKTFDPEFVDAFELGAKNTLLGGRLTANLAAFYYDYKGYQLSQIIDRTAITQNFDATVWGLELEADWRPLENLHLGFKGGYEKTKVGDGMRAIDIMDRTAGTPGWSVVSPFPTFPSNCVLPTWLYAGVSGAFNGDYLPAGSPELVNLGNPGGGGPGGCEWAYLAGVDPILDTGHADQQLIAHPGYPGWDPNDESQFQHNHGEGFFKDLSGNELPNAPNFTATITADYTVPLPLDWLMTLHTDLYYQSEAWWRIFNTPGYDKLKAYTNVNVAAIFANEDHGWKVMAYVKNVFDRDSITGAFLNSDDSGLTTNVFLTEPRLYGLRVTKEFSGGPWWTGANLNHGGPFPLTVELGGQVQRHDAPYQNISPESFANLDAPLATTVGLQNRDMDWGDGRSLKVTWRPSGSRWAVSGSYRYGKTNTDLARGRTELAGTVERCYTDDPIFVALICEPGGDLYDVFPQGRFYPTLDWSDEAVRSREEHAFTELKVSYDFAPASLISNSSVSLGLRQARFESTTDLNALAQGDWDVPVAWLFNPVTFVRSTVLVDARRKFNGAGPVLTWDAAAKLWGAENQGHLDVDWSINAGALYGNQETAFSGRQEVGPFNSQLNLEGAQLITSAGPATPVALPGERSNSVTAPFVDLAAGLSYEVGRVKVGGGYRWERYFNVLDGGFAEHKSYDRTLDGPYFKIAVGFGG